MTADISGTQAGDPVRAGEVMIRVAEMADPPRYLVLGAQGHGAVLKKLHAAVAEIEGLRDLALAADFPNP
jgi:hypothetical protein